VVTLSKLGKLIALTYSSARLFQSRIYFLRMKTHTTTAFTAGKFLITPMSRTCQNGRFIASLSVRRGQKSQTHDKVYSFHPEFESADSALTYATAQGHNWLINPKAFA
jgi:hypothetical protein